MVVAWKGMQVDRASKSNFDFSLQVSLKLRCELLQLGLGFIVILIGEKKGVTII
jgi:hypothetical protein